MRRLRGALIAGPCIALLVVAWLLSPRAGGFGTHQQLNMPGCSILANTGWPCPTCGFTTSVSATVQGDFLFALRAHPFGPVLVLALVVFGLAGVTELITSRNILGIFHLRWWWVVLALGGILIGWAIKLTIGITSGTLPLR